MFPFIFYRENKWSGKVTPFDKLEGKKDQFFNERKKNTMFPFVYPMVSLDFQALLQELENANKA
jgi:hypothetical protein